VAQLTRRESASAGTVGRSWRKVDSTSAALLRQYLPQPQNQWRRRGLLIPFVLWLTRVKTTPNGLLVFVGWALTSTVGAVSLEIPVYLLVCAWTAPALLAFVLGWLMRPRVVVNGAVPSKITAGTPYPIAVSIRNDTRRPVFDCAAGIFDLPREISAVSSAALASLEPSESAVLTVMVQGERRGYYVLPPLRVFSLFPFGYFRTTAAKTELPPLLVLPSFQPLHELSAPTGRRYQPRGVAFTSQIGESTEFVGNREYRSGDSRRDIDFRAWGRLARPVVREYQEEYYSRVALVLDTYDTKLANADAFESAISLSAAVAEALTNGPYLIDVFAAGPQLHVLRTGRQVSSLDSVLEALACVQACRNNPFDLLIPALQEELARISTVICVLLDWDAARERLVATAAEAGCACKVLVVRDGPATLPLESAAAFTRDISQLRPSVIAAGKVDRL